MRCCSWCLSGCLGWGRKGPGACWGAVRTPGSRKLPLRPCQRSTMIVDSHVQICFFTYQTGLQASQDSNMVSKDSRF